jgi:DNA ligase (NAD+)
LRASIREHDDRYYVLDRPTIPDARYDRLFNELVRLERDDPSLVTPDSPTQRVAGRPLRSFPSIRHVAPMLSLESTTRDDDIRCFDERVRATLRGAAPEYVLEPKFDGLSLELVYEHGRLVRASTRGDGERGEGVTENVRTIRAVPLQLHGKKRAVPTFLAVRGEAMMPVRDFERVNQQLAREGRPLFANPRNAAAGSVRQLDPRVTAGRRLDVVCYDILALEGNGRVRTGTEALEALQTWGLRVSHERQIGHTVSGIARFRETLQGRRDTLGYEVDGIVIKLNDLGARERLGMTARHPRWALAFKFAPRDRETIIEDIAVQVGRTGVLTPVAVLTPVEIGGVTVARATLHNRGEIVRKDLRVGDAVRVVRAGDVIPEIVGRIHGRRGRRPFAMPRRCPACHSSIVREGPIDRCPNGLACPAQLRGAVQHFGSRAALDIHGLGRETVEQLVSAGLVRSIADLFTLRERDLRRLGRFGTVSAHHLVRAIGKARDSDLYRFIHALGIPGVGEQSARDLAEHFGRLDALMKAREADLEGVSGIGRTTARNIAEFFRRAETRRVIAACRRSRLRLRGVRRKK